MARKKTGIKSSKVKKLSFIDKARRGILIIFVLVFANVGALTLILTQAATYEPNWSTSRQDEMFDLINLHRYFNNRSSLSHSRCLNDAARSHAKTMANKQELYHSHFAKLVDQKCGGTTYGTWRKLGENVGRGWSVDSLHKAFVESPGHRANMEDKDFNMVGVGVYLDSKGQHWVSQIYARCTGCGGPWTQSPRGPFEPTEVTTTTTNTKPKGHFDSTTDKSSSIYACRKLQGWAFDPDESSKSLRVHIYIDGSGTSIAADDPRGDVNNAYNITGDHGFSWMVPTKYHDGQEHNIKVYAIDTSSGNTLLTDTKIKCPRPTGHVDIVSCSRVAGWAADLSDTRRQVELHIYFSNLDGSGKQGYPGIYTTATRDDVKRYLENKGYYSNGEHGFNFSVPSHWSGKPHRTFVYAINHSTNPRLIYDSDCR